MKKKDILGVALFYAFIVVGVILINARMEQINKVLVVLGC